MKLANICLIFGLSFVVLLFPDTADAALRKSSTVIEKQESTGYQKRLELHDGQTEDKDVLQSIPDSRTSSNVMMPERKTAEEEDSSITSDDFLTMFLESSECSAFIENKVTTVENILSYGDEVIVNYACNDIKRQELLLKKTEMETLVADHSPGSIT